MKPGPIQHVVLCAIFLLVLASFSLSRAAGSPAASPDLTLWYDKPAARWMTEALPVGNGRLGAMIFGGVEKERVQFNESSL